MLNNHLEILGGILIGSILFLCLIFFLITIYFFYHSRQKTISFQEKPPTNINHHEDSNRNDININQMKKSEEEINDLLNNEKTSPRIIGELMRKSLQLAQTAEQVADQNEKRFILKDNIHLYL